MTVHCDPASKTQIYEFPFEPTTKKTLNFIEDGFTKFVTRSDALNRHIACSSLLVMALPLFIIALFVLFRWPHLSSVAYSVRAANFKYTPRARVKVIATATNVTNLANSRDTAMNVVDLLNVNATEPQSESHKANITIEKDETRTTRHIQPAQSESEAEEEEEETKVSRAKRRRDRKQRKKITHSKANIPEPEPETEPDTEPEPEPEPTKAIKRRKRKAETKRRVEMQGRKRKSKKSRLDREPDEEADEHADGDQSIRKVKKRNKVKKATKPPMTSTTSANATRIMKKKIVKKRKKKKIVKVEEEKDQEIMENESAVVESTPPSSAALPTPKPVSKYVANVFEAFYFENEPSPDFAEISDSKTSPTNSQQQPTVLDDTASVINDTASVLDWELGLDDREFAELQELEHVHNAAAIDVDIDVPHFKPAEYSNGGRDISSTPFAVEQRPSPTPPAKNNYLFRAWRDSAPPRILKMAHYARTQIQKVAQSAQDYYGAKEQRPNFNEMSMYDILTISPPLTLRELVDCNLVYRFVRDQGGSRRVQCILDGLNAEECTAAVSMMVAHLISTNASMRFMSMCIYGNYLMQMFFEKGTERDREAMLHNFVFGSALQLSQNKFGCRVMQTVLATVRMEHKLELVRCFREQLGGHSLAAVLKCQHANHVLQKMLEQELPLSTVQFVRDELESNLAHFSANVYACRVVQSMIQAYGDELEVALLLTEDGGHLALSKSRYGNYVIQCIIAQKAWYSNLQRIYNFRMRLTRDVLEPQNLWDLSQDKHGSNVIEVCIKAATEMQLEQLVAFLADGKGLEGAYLLRKMAMHQYANYVVKTLIEHCNDALRRKMVLAIHRNVTNLRSYNEFGGHGQFGYADELLTKCKHLMLSFETKDCRRSTQVLAQEKSPRLARQYKNKPNPYTV